MIFGKHINVYYRKYALALLTGLLALFTVDYLNLKVPEIYQLVINGLNQGYIVENGVQVPFDMAFLLDRICMPMVGIILVIVFGRFLWRVTIFGAATRVETDLRNKMFRHAEDLSREYYQVNKVGNLMSLFTNDLDTVQECYGWGFMQFFDPIILCSLAITKMWRMDHLLTVLSLIPMGLLFASAAVVGRNMTKKWDYRQKCFSDLSDFAQESFSGIAVIKAFVKEARELMAFEKLNRDSEDSNIAFTKTSVLMRILVTTNVEFTKASVLLRILVELFVESVVAVILGYGGYLVYQGKFNAGQLMEFIGYFNAVVWPIMAVADLIDMTSRGKASLKRISELLDAPRNVFDRPGVQELTNPKGEIEFRDLSFTYPDGESPALEHVSFTIHPGESIGLLGKTGSGKTTLVDLILRTYNVNDGQLFLDGRDVNDLSIRSVRDACAYVPQDNFLFSDTIENNIAFGKSETVSEEIRRAAKLADIDGNISEFQQKQRISIARALMKDAPILILDDSVSAVDTKTEKAILDNLRATRAGKTTILIAHRISTIEQMDKVLFIEGGRLAGFDTHAHLYANNPAYRKMVDLQRLEEEGGAVNA